MLNDFTGGILFLKVTIQLAHIDTRATIMVICTCLTSGDSRMVQIQDTITEFKEYVKTQCICLEAHGETTLDFLVNLFEGYKAVADDRFIKYIECKEDE
jgi:hypothetical protein